MSGTKKGERAAHVWDLAVVLQVQKARGQHRPELCDFEKYQRKISITVNVRLPHMLLAEKSRTVRLDQSKQGKTDSRFTSSSSRHG